MKTYRNERHGFEIRIPEEWSAYTEGKALAGKSLVFKCRTSEAFHIETTPLTVTPFPYQVENEFRRLAEKKGYTNLIFGRFNADGKEHVFARFYMGYGQWMKTYRIILRGFDYMLTATCLDEKSLLEMEKDWDEIAASFCLMKRMDEPIVEKGEEEKKGRVIPVSQPIIRTDPFDLNKAMQILAMPVRVSEIPRRIDLCQQALAHVDRKLDPETWAGLEVELAKNIGQNPQGDRAENIEQAILHNQRGLEVFNRTVYPEYWANIHINLGSNYRNRLYGDHAENLEQALVHCQQGLDVVTKKNSPYLWASAHNNMANVYRDRVYGERVDNLEHAIDHIKQSLDVLTHHAFPFQWATAQNNLGNAYQDRMLGERELNIEQAIFCYQQALEVFKRETFPEDWAWTQCNLGTSYHSRVRGDKSENMETSILHSKRALEVFTKETLPEKWALTHVNLGNAYLVRKDGERTENLKLGIDHFQLALSVFTQLTYPERWAGLQFHVATANQLLSENELETIAMENKENISEVRPPAIHLTYPGFYNEILRHNPDTKRRLKLIYSEVPDNKFAKSMLLVYQWEDELSSDLAESLKRRAVAFLACAIYDAARSSNLPCEVSPIPNGQRPAWMVEGERSPVSLTLSDIDMDDRTLQMSIGPVMVALHSLPVNKVPLEKIMNGFREKFSEIMV